MIAKLILILCIRLKELREKLQQQQKHLAELDKHLYGVLKHRPSRSSLLIVSNSEEIGKASGGEKN